MTGRRLVWVLVPLLAVALLLELGRARRLWQGSRAAAIVKDVTIEANRRGRLSRRVLTHNLELLRVAEPMSPVEVALPIARGGQYLLLKRPQAAIRAYERALEIEPRGEIYVHLGRAYLTLGDREAAEEAFSMAMILDHTQRRRVRGFVTKRLRRSSVAPEPAPGADESNDAGESTDGEQEGDE